MGKKKVARKTSEELLKESESVAAAFAKKTATGGKERYEEGRIYINASFNNTLISVTDMQGNVITWMSAGSLGFSGPKKATPFAASKVAEAIVEKLQKTGPGTVAVLMKGVGSGRDAAVRSLANRGMNILSVTDITPIPHNGPRPPKVRRV